MSLPSNNRFSYAELPMACYNMANSIINDIEVFKKYGITIEEMEEFKRKIELHNNMETDEEYVGRIMDATIIKNNLSKQLRSQLRMIITWLRTRYTSNTELRTRLNISNIYKQPDLKLHETIERAILVFRDLISNADNREAIDNEIDILEQINNEFNTTIQNRLQLQDQRKAAAFKRRKHANDLYKQLAAYSELGKNIWENDVRQKHYLMKRLLK